MRKRLAISMIDDNWKDKFSSVLIAALSDHQLLLCSVPAIPKQEGGFSTLWATLE
ncbi:MAG: hypothetical protein ACO1QB_17915 [Verrucomicrobiales bacterium]